jgi:hypothetical protein
MTETEFAEKIGSTQSHVNKLRAHKIWPRKGLARRIKEVTGDEVTPMFI